MTPADDPDEFARQLAAARAGSADALGWLFARLRPYLHSVAGGELGTELHARGSASDVVQDALLEAQGLLDRFTGGREEEFRAWMRAVLLNKLSDFRRRHHARKRAAGRETSLDASGEQGRLRDAVPAAGPRPSEAVRKAEEADLLNRAMAALSEDYRQVIQLRSWEGLPFAEVGERMGRSADAARMLWGRAVQALSDELERFG